VTHPFLHHVKRNAIRGGIDTEAMTQPLGTSVRCIGDTRRDHHLFDDLPYPYAADRPYLLARAALRLLRFPDAVRRVERVQALWRHWHGSKHQPLSAAWQVSFFETPYRNGTARQVDPPRRQLDQL